MTTACENSTVRILKQIPSFEVLGDELHALLKAAKLWACSDTTRPHLNVVRIEVSNRFGNRVRVVSTNGHGMYIGHCAATTLREGFCSLTMDCVEALLNASKATRRKAEPVQVTFSGIDRTLKVGNLSVILTTCDDDFPPYERVVPSEPPSGLKDGFVGLGLNYLGMVAKTFPGKQGVTVEFYGAELDPVVFRGETVNGEEAKLVLMPMRV